MAQDIRRCNTADKTTRIVDLEPLVIVTDENHPRNRIVSVGKSIHQSFELKYVNLNKALSEFGQFRLVRFGGTELVNENETLPATI